MTVAQDCDGDTGKNRDCADIDDWECYDSSVRRDCCATCQDIKDAIGSPLEGCKYGDRISSCASEIGSVTSHCYDNSTRADCCYTCFNLESNIPGCTYGDRISSCASEVGSVTSHCYENITRVDCCRTCYNLETDIPECAFGNRVDGCSSTVGPYGRFCYDSTIRYDCCDTCDYYETTIPGCRYGDRIEGCRSSQCYTAQEQYDCCATCYNTTATTWSTWASTTSTEATPTTTSTTAASSGQDGSSETPDWVVPVVASAAGVIVILVIILVACFCLRRRRKKPDAINDQMYQEYKISKRAPVAPPRPDPEVERRSKLVRQDSAEYAYINPDHLDSTPDQNTNNTENPNKRTGNDPLPDRPKEYVYLTNPDKYGYMEPTSKKPDPPGPYTELQGRQPDPYTHLSHAGDEEQRRHNSYGEFPQASRHNPNNAVVSERL